MSTKPSILVVDDEYDLVNLVRYNLQKEGYNVLFAYDGSSALEIVWEQKPDLIVLDLMLPDLSGIDICRQIKGETSTKKIPIIMLTARSSERDRISGFEAGAEDYVVKPFSPKELVLRVKALLARTQKEVPNIIELGPITIHPDGHRVFIDQQEVPLTHLEFKILMALIRYPETVKTREQLLADVWGADAAEILDRTVDAHVKRLRGKMGSQRDSIETVRGVGYRFILPNTSSSSSQKESS